MAWWCSATGQVWTWRYTPFVGVWLVTAGLIGAYVLAHRRAGRALDPARTRAWIAGALAIFAVSEWPLGPLGAGYLATIGIARYVVFTFVAAPLLLSGLPGWLIDRWLPDGSRRARAVSALTHWPVALVVFNVVLIGTHLPITIDAFKATQLGSFAIDTLHLFAALVWWWPAIRTETHRNAIDEPARSFYLFASSVLMFVPASFLTFSPLPLYGLYELAPPLWLSFDPLQDQQAAGIMMKVIGGFVLWGIIAVRFLRWAGRQQRDDVAARRVRDATRIAAAQADHPDRPSTS
ncbi:MAG: cytochrome c oxidase assembly protein [Nitriliruptoraceae bacterium]